tara:strand:+ start:668 stop:1243 length:576 start_codon:yes stop_codon:yes gene_type:complete
MRAIENYLIQESVLQTFNKALFDKLARTIEVLKSTKLKVNMIPASIKALISKLFKSLPFATKKIEQSPEFINYKKYTESLLNFKDLNMQATAVQTITYLSIYKAKKDNSNIKDNIKYYSNQLKKKLIDNPDPLVVKYLMASIMLTLVWHTIVLKNVNPLIPDSIIYIYGIVAIIFLLLFIFNIDITKSKKQ